MAIAVAWAIVAAFGHVTVVNFRQHVLHAFTGTTPLFELTAPIAYVGVFLALAVPIALIFRFVRLPNGYCAVHGVFAGLAAFSILLLYRRIHPLAFVVLAAGMGWQVSRWCTLRPEVLQRLTRRAGPVMALLLVLNGGLPHILSWWQERSALGATRTAPEDAPNVLLLILDTVRAANLSLYGYQRPTSAAIDSLAASGIVYDNAFTPSSWSLPSHASLLTGVWGHETGASYLRRANDDLPRVSTVLRQHGYLTGAFMGNAGWAGPETGLAAGFHRYVTYPDDLDQIVWNTTLTQTPLARGIIGGIVTRDPMRMVRSIARFDLRAQTPITPDRMRAPAVTASFLAWRDLVGTKHPWFATLNIFDAHEPYATPYSDRFNAGATNVDKYDGSIAWIDSVVGALFTELRSRGDLDRTLVIVTSDHGELFGEHGEFKHGSGLYLPIVHVPLVLRYPNRITAGVRVPGLATTADIPATIIDAAGISDSAIPGRSLMSRSFTDDGDPYVLFMSSRMINQPATRRASHGEVYGVLNSEWHLMRFAGDEEELYRWRDDSAETINYVDSVSGRAVLPGLQRLLDGRRRVR